MVVNAAVTVVLRECGERTADRCFEHLTSGLAPWPVHRVSDRPFAKTLRRSLELGVREGREFTLCIDADLTPDPIPLKKLVGELASRSPHVLAIQGLVRDRLFLIQRPAGNHLYRTSLLPQAQREIVGVGDTLRPESAMLSAMTKRGYPWLQSALVVGDHDVGQRYEDIYRKAFLHTRKHAEFVGYLGSLWEELALDRPEFAVARLAWEDSRAFDGAVAVDRSFLLDSSRQRIETLGLSPSSGPKDLGDPISLLSRDLRARRAAIEARMRRRIFMSVGALRRRVLASGMMGALWTSRARNR